MQINIKGKKLEKERDYVIRVKKFLKIPEKRKIYLCRWITTRNRNKMRGKVKRRDRNIERQRWSERNK